MSNAKKIMSMLCIFMALCILMTSCSSAERIRNTALFTSESSGNTFRTPSADTEIITKGAYTQLVFDKKTYTVSVKDISEGYTWETLTPTDSIYSYAFGVTLYTDNGIYHLNTQDNSVAFGTASFEKKDNTLTVSYILSDKKETAEKPYEEITKKDAYAAFSVDYKLTEQTMAVSLNTAEMKLTPGSFISEISVLPSFGASFADGVNDSFLIPDGPGALMQLKNADTNTESISVNVYGKDPFTGITAEGAVSTVPVFGIRRNNSAFCAVITDGDALATINAERKQEKNPSHASAVFSITPVCTDENGTPVKRGASYNGNITLKYKFLSGRNADCISMASAAREEFITNGVLSSSGIDSNAQIPFNLTVVGADSASVLTTTEQTLDILGILKGKGINNIKLNYKGLLSGGIAQKNLYNAHINSKLGGNDGLEQLYEYTKKQGCELLINTNIFSSSGSYLTNKSPAVSGKNAYFDMPNDLAFRENTSNSLVTRIGTQASELGKQKANPSIYSPTQSYRMNLLSLSVLPDKFSAFLENNMLTMADGIAVSDAGRVLYSDSNTDRETAKDIISAQTRAVSDYGTFTVEGGNIYTVYNASLVSGMDFDTFYAESAGYEPVPFVQAILHGYTFYTGVPIDAGDPLYRYNMLRFIEFGALPSYEWIYSNANIYCYSGYLLAERVSEIVDFYNDACEILGPVADETIISHKKIKTDADGKAVTGVYCTTYSDGTEVYVNYTGSIVSTSGNIAVGPYDYVAVKR